MAHVHERAELVDREEVPDPVAQLFGDVPRIVCKGLCRVAGLPPAPVLKRLWQVPVEEVDEWLDARTEQGIDEALVEVEASLVGYPCPVGQGA